MNIWLLNCFSAVPVPESPEQRTAALASVLQRRGCQVTWFTSDWCHLSKARLCEPGTYMLTSAQPCLDPHMRPLTRSDDQSGVEREQGGALRLEVVSTPPYRRNVGAGRLFSHFEWARRLRRRATALVAAGRLDQPDVIVASSPPIETARVGRRLAERFNSAFAIDLTDLWPHAFASVVAGSSVARVVATPAITTLRRVVEHDWRLACGVSAVSRAYLDVVSTIAPWQRMHCCYIGGYASSADGDPAAAPTDRRRQHGSSESPSGGGRAAGTAFVYVGLMSESYDLTTLIEACAALAAESLRFSVTLAGDGPLVAALDRRIHEAGLEKSVTFVGRLAPARLKAVLAESDVGLNVVGRGRWITMPNKLSDYLCSGLAVVNSLPGEAASLLSAHHAGISYESGDVRSLADAMRRYIVDADLTAAEKVSARALARVQFDRPHTYQEWASWLLQLPKLSSNRSPSSI